ncbi:MAG: lipid-A-disaccharide synthase [Caldimicrobium sp.]
MRVLIITGELSGDLYASLLVKKIRELNPSFHFLGIGGPKLRGSDAEILFSAEALSLVGIPKPSDLKKYLFIYRKVEDILRKRKVDLVILVDFPGFNLKIAKLAKSLNYPVVYYVAPQIWAWYKNRIKILKSCVDLLFVVLPFEEEFFKNYGIPVKYYGHPLVDIVKVNQSKELFFTIYGLEENKTLISFFPGSREGEVARHLPLFIKVYRKFKKRRPDCVGILGKAQGLKDSPLWEEAKRDMLVLENMPYEILKYSHVALLASGTITLEAALLETPAVVTYNLPSWMYLIAKKLVKVPYISLPNLILGKEVYPEILQNKQSPEALVVALEEMLRKGEEIKRELQNIRALLGKPGVTWKIAEEIIKFAQTLKKY